MRRCVLPILVLLAGCAGRSVPTGSVALTRDATIPAPASAGTPPHPSSSLPSPAGALVPTVLPVPTARATVAPVTTSTPSSGEPTPDDVVTGLLEVQDQVVVCLTDAPACDSRSVAAFGSPAYAVFEEVRQQFVRLDLTVQLVPELTYVVVEDVQPFGPDRAVVTLCEVDGSWQMDRRGTADPADDAVWNDQLVSRRATHEMIRTAEGWRRFELVELDLWRGENRCPPRPAA